MTSPIRYTSRTYSTILSDIDSNTELVDKPNWFKRLIAGIGDMLSVIENASANQSFLRTAFTRQAVMDLCQLIDYDLSPKVESSGILIFYVKGTASFPFTVNEADIAGVTQATIAIASKRFEGRANKTVSASSETFTANPADDKLTIARVYTTGEKVRLTTSGADLPEPLAINTDYYVIYVSATTIRLATSVANAYAGTYIDITDAGTGTHTIHLYSFQETCYSQDSLASSLSIGQSDGTTEWQEFDLPHNWVLRDTLTVTINGDLWTRVTTFVNSISTDKHFKLLYKKDGKSYIQFGNGTYGAIPGLFDIYVNYSYGGGSDCNVSVANKINIYAGADSNIEGCSNPSSFTGGADEETLENAKMNAPMLLKSRDRFVTSEDGEALIANYGGIIRSNSIPNAYGLLSVKIVIVPAGGGAPSSALKTALDTYLTDRTILESIDVRVEDPSYYTFNVTAAMKIKSDYAWADVLPFFRLAVRLLVSEVTSEIVTTYQSVSIDSAVAYINNKWSESFDAEDYPQIQAMLDELYERDMIPDFGQRYDESEVLGFMQMFVHGCEYVTWSLPALPITLTESQIGTAGSMTLTEIT